MIRETLKIQNLSLSFRSYAGLSEVLHDVSLTIAPEERVALVGESGSGKSVTARAVLGLLQSQSNVQMKGRILFEGQDLAELTAAERRGLRGTRMSMIFQDPVSSLNPYFRIEDLFREVFRRSDSSISRSEVRLKAADYLREVSITEPERVLSSFSFQLSGGMNQRVMIAMALVNQPALLIADEPGTALDVTVQDQTLRLMRGLVEDRGAAVLFISHNLGVVREFSDWIYVIYRGRIVESGSTREVFSEPRHPYTRALLAAVPRITAEGLPDIVEFSEDFLAPCVVHGAREVLS